MGDNKIMLKNNDIKKGITIGLAKIAPAMIIIREAIMIGAGVLLFFE